MALQKEIEAKGIGLEYWRIVRTASDADLNQTICDVGGYLDAMAREDNPQNFVSVRSYSFPTKGLSFEACYIALKGYPEFQSAIDC